MNVLSIAYNALTPDEKQFYVDMAKGARDQVGKLRPGEGIFGFKSKDLRRQQSKARAEATAARLGANRDGDAAREPISRRRAAFEAVSSVTSRPTNRSLHELVVAAKKEQRCRMNEMCRNRANDEKALKVWAETKGVALREEIVAQNPALKPFKDFLFPVPDLDDVVFELLPTADSAVKAALAADLASRTSNVGRAMMSDFDAMSAPILRDLAEPIQEDKARKGGPPPCYTVGICLCKGEGALVYKMRNRYLATLKTLCKPVHVKELLRSQSIVVCLRGKLHDTI